jgi:hypothetical protein
MFRNEYYLLKGSHTWLKDKVFTMIDDHDQVWRGGDYKGRFCAQKPGPQLMLSALGLNLCTLGIPCIYYGSEQCFDGSGGSGSPGHSNDQYIREAMFGGGYGAFRSKDRHCFDESSEVFKGVAQIAKIRSQSAVLKRGRQYLREISGDGNGWGYPYKLGGRILSVVAWSRILDGEEIICAINTDESQSRTAWVTVDSGIQVAGHKLQCLYPSSVEGLVVEQKSDRLAVRLTVAAGGVVLFK